MRTAGSGTASVAHRGCASWLEVDWCVWGGTLKRGVMLGRIGQRVCGRAVVGRASGAGGRDGAARNLQRASAVMHGGYQSDACAEHVSGTRPACAGRAQFNNRAPASACFAPSRALGTVAAPDDVDGLRSLGRGVEPDDARDNVDEQVWRRSAGPSTERSRLRTKFEETGVCEACVLRRADAWAELSSLHTQLDKLAVGSTAVLPESWAEPMLIGRGAVAADGVAMPGPPARWQLGRKSATCGCCGGEEHETSTRQQFLR
eukprot:COSAG02_NODE_3646_length_6430_cov_5.383036_2_plen_260_part_00